MTQMSLRSRALTGFVLCGALTAFLATLAIAQTSPARSSTTGAGDLVLHGQTEPAAKCEIPAAVRGILAEVNVKEGQAIKKGQPLAKLDDALQRQKVEYERIGAESTKEIEYAQSQASFARQDYEATKRALSNQGMEVLQKESTLQTAELSVGVAQEKQKQNQVRYQQEQIILDHMTLRSPIDGSILRVNKQVGEQTDDNPVLVVVQTSKLIAIFYPPRDLFGKIAYGDKVPLDLEGAKCEGVVVAVDPIIDPASQIFRVKLEVDNKDGKLAAGVNAAWTWSKK